MKRLILALLLIAAPVQATDKAKIDALYAKRKADDKQLLANVRESRAARAKTKLESERVGFLAQLLAAQQQRNRVAGLLSDQENDPPRRYSSPFQQRAGSSSGKAPTFIFPGSGGGFRTDDFQGGGGTFIPNGSGGGFFLPN